MNVFTSLKYRFGQIFAELDKQFPRRCKGCGTPFANPKRGPNERPIPLPEGADYCGICGRGTRTEQEVWRRNMNDHGR
jgi:hypothetical protein